MSTRCQIGFTNKIVSSEELATLKPEALIYRHSDGYPAGVLPDVVPFVEWFGKARGLNDLEYLSARLLQYLCNEYDGITKKISEKYKHLKEEFNEAFTGTLGHGISNTFHLDIEYYYNISPEALQVFKVKETDPLEGTELFRYIFEEKDKVEKLDKFLTSK